MNLPIDFENRMKDMLKEDYPAFKKAFSADDEHIGIRITKPEAASAVMQIIGRAERVKWCENGYYTDKSVISGKHPYHIAGLVYFQEPSAMLPVSVLPIEKDDFVLDLCASPGGKSTQISEKLGKNGLLVANEIIPKRAEILAENIERCGAENTVITNENPERLAQKFPEFFDKIVVDAPCSGEGMFRKEPQAAEQWSIAHTVSCALRQQNILDCALKMLRPGGLLIYSTCTFSPDENEKNVDYLLSNHPEISLLPINAEGGSNGISKYSSFDMTPAKRIFPHLAEGEGHFAALFKKDGVLEKRSNRPFNNTPPEVFAKFERDTFTTVHTGFFHTFGDRLYLLPDKICFDKIKVTRPGLYLGDIKKGRFEPSHALSHAHKAPDFKKTLNFSSDSEELLKFLKGDVLPCELKGWVCVLADNFPIGWGKAGGGILKNHFPKRFRL